MLHELWGIVFPFFLFCLYVFRGFGFAASADLIVSLFAHRQCLVDILDGQIVQLTIKDYDEHAQDDKLGRYVHQQCLVAC